MADNRTGLSAADIAEQFRDMAGDGSMEWVSGPMHVWALLDAADMLDENEQFRVTMGAVTSANECMDLLVAENDKLRELVADMAEELLGLGVDFKRVGWCDYADRMRELGVEP